MAGSCEERLRMSDLIANGDGEIEQGEEDEDHPVSDGSSFKSVTSEAEEDPQPSSMKPSDGKRHVSSLEQSYSEQIRPLLDVVDRLRNLDVPSEGIDLPSIVVIGDQSSGKSSVLESLACVRLPKGEGICTRVPLVLRLQSSGSSDHGAGAGADTEKEDQPKISIKYLDRDPDFISEDAIPERIAAATDAIAGTGKGIAHDHITLHIVRRGAPDLTLIDLPGITRVPLPDQPPDIYEQIKDLVLRYISPAESIILNVLSAHIDFPTAESIRWSKQVDASGDRTLAVVTKCDERPDGLWEKITANAVEIGQGYICVRNCLRGETLAEAREKETALFTSHRLLRSIDKSLVGVPALASKLMHIQATKIRSAIPTLLAKVDEALAGRQRELQALPPPPCRPEEAHVVFVKLLRAMADGLRRLLLDGDRKDHCGARLRKMCEKFLGRLRKANAVEPERFMGRESQLLEQARGHGLRNFLPRVVFRGILRGLVESVAPAAEELVQEAWHYLEREVQRVVRVHCGAYPTFYVSVQMTVMDIVEQAKKLSIEHVREMLLVEKVLDFTLTPTYMRVYSQMLQAKTGFLDAAYHKSSVVILHAAYHKSSVVLPMTIDGLGEVDVTVARSLLRPQAEAAYDMAISVAAYWQVVTLRLGDGVPMLLHFRVREFERMLLEKLYDADKPHSMGRLMAESSAVSSKRYRLKHSIALLQNAKATLSVIFIDQPSCSTSAI